LNKIAALEDLVGKYVADTKARDVLFVKEFILWALVELEKLSKNRVQDGMLFKDAFSAYFSKL